MVCTSEHKATNEALWACSYGTWYPRYAAHAINSKIIELDQQAVDFLHEDGLVLHEESDALPQRAKATDIIVEGVDYDPHDLYSDDNHPSSSSSSSDDSSSSSPGSSAAAEPWPQRLPALHAALAAGLKALGGRVAPRLNWSSPTDALWLSSSTSLMCTSPGEVLLLLKGSDRVAHDLDLLQDMEGTAAHTTEHTQQGEQQQQGQQQQQCTEVQTVSPRQQLPAQQAGQPPPAAAGISSSSGGSNASATAGPSLQSGAATSAAAAAAAAAHPTPHHSVSGSTRPSSSGTAGSSSCSSSPSLRPQLVLRAWVELEPQCCFRCFVQQHSLVAISQRDPSQHFPQLTGGEAAKQLLEDVRARLLDFHKRVVSNGFPIASYAMDVYVPPRGPLKLMDFSPICATTSPLCFTWEELPYTHMRQQQHGTGTAGQQQHEQGSGAAAQQQGQQECLEHPAGQQQQGGHKATSAGPGSSYSGGSSRGGGAVSGDAAMPVLLRVVEHEGMVVPGSRVATGMPYDMLGLPDAVSCVMQAMQQQQLRQ